VIVCDLPADELEQWTDATMVMLGAKTMEIVHSHLKDVTIDSSQLEKVAMDAGRRRREADTPLSALPINKFNGGR